MVEIAYLLEGSGKVECSEILFSELTGRIGRFVWFKESMI